jgi:hypothetical protein
MGKHAEYERLLGEEEGRGRGGTGVRYIQRGLYGEGRDRRGGSGQIMQNE